MYTSLIIHDNQVKKMKTNYFEIFLNFSLGCGERKSLSIEATESSDVIELVNDLENLGKWFTEESLNTLINSSLLKEYLISEVFDMEEEGQDIRFDNDKGDLYIIWINDAGDQCPVELR